MDALRPLPSTFTSEMHASAGKHSPPNLSPHPRRRVGRGGPAARTRLFPCPSKLRQRLPASLHRQDLALNLLCATRPCWPRAVAACTCSTSNGAVQCGQRRFAVPPTTACTPVLPSGSSCSCYLSSSSSSGPAGSALTCSSGATICVQLAGPCSSVATPVQLGCHGRPPKPPPQPRHWTARNRHPSTATHARYTAPRVVSPSTGDGRGSALLPLSRFHR